MKRNRERKPDGFYLATVRQGDGRPRLTKLEQAIQDQNYVIAALRNKARGDETTPGGLLKNDDEKASAPHATIEKNISSSSEDENNSQNSVLKNNLEALDKIEEEVGE